MYALSPRAEGIHIRQIPPAHVTTYLQIIITMEVNFFYSTVASTLNIFYEYEICINYIL